MEDSGLLLNTGTNRESIDHLLAIPPSDDENCEDEFPRIQVVPRDVEF